MSFYFKISELRRIMKLSKDFFFLKKLLFFFYFTYQANSFLQNQTTHSQTKTRKTTHNQFIVHFNRFCSFFSFSMSNVTLGDSTKNYLSYYESVYRN